MVIPQIAARIEQRKDDARFRVGGFRLVAFLVVASAAGVRQIFQHSLPAVSDGIGMVYFVGGSRMRVRVAAVFAATSRPVADLLTLARRRVFSRGKAELDWFGRLDTEAFRGVGEGMIPQSGEANEEF